jgi:anti-anti-sigma factor
MNGRTAGQPDHDSWSAEVGRCEPQSPLAITFSRPPATLRLAGVIDESTYQVLRRALAKAAMGGDCALRVDMAGVDFCDLAGLRLIVSLADSGQAAVSQVTIAHLPTHLTDIMHILGWAGAPGLVLLEAGR